LFKRLATLAMALAAGLSPTHAGTLLTTEVGYTGPILNLSSYANRSYNDTFGPAPIPGGITFTSNNGGGNSGRGSILGQGSYGLRANGDIVSIPVYAGLDSGTGFMTFTFSSPISEFGAFMNYAPLSGDNPTIKAFDTANNLLDSFDLAALAPISTPCGQRTRSV
jgi:hypothetical protein